MRYCDAFLEGHNLYIVTEYARGGDLHGKIKRYTKKRKSMPEDMVWSYLAQMCHGLYSLHRVNVLHRDLKPKNIFITEHNAIRLGDLGCAKIMKAGMARTQIGTPYYMSPEIWQHQAYNAASDMWAVGCIVFEMCSGRPPFLADDMQGLARKVRYSPSPRISSAYSRDLASLIKRLMSKEPRLRPTAKSIIKMEPVTSRHHLIPETPENSRWNHKNMKDHEVHVRHGVLSTIKVPKNRHYSGKVSNLKLPEACYPVKKLEMDNVMEVQSSPVRPSTSPAKVMQRPTSAGGARPSRRPKGPPPAHNKANPRVQRYDNRGHRIPSKRVPEKEIIEKENFRNAAPKMGYYGANYGKKHVAAQNPAAAGGHYGAGRRNNYQRGGYAQPLRTRLW